MAMYNQVITRIVGFKFSFKRGNSIDSCLYIIVMPRSQHGAFAVEKSFVVSTEIIGRKKNSAINILNGSARSISNPNLLPHVHTHAHARTRAWSEWTRICSIVTTH